MNANKLLGLAIGAVVVGMLVVSWPEIERYRRMMMM
jgi:hypothetical protein